MKVIIELGQGVSEEIAKELSNEAKKTFGCDTKVVITSNMENEEAPEKGDLFLSFLRPEALKEHTLSEKSDFGHEILKSNGLPWYHYFVKVFSAR